MRKIVCTRCAGNWGIQHVCSDGYADGAKSTIIFEPEACKCKGAYFQSLLAIIEDLARPDKMSETTGTLLRRFEDLRIRAQKIVGKEGEVE